MTNITDKPSLFQIFDKNTKIVAENAESESGLLKILKLCDVTTANKVCLEVKKSYTDLINTDLISKISFSHIFLGLIALILFLALFEKFYVKIFNDRASQFFKKHHLFGILYGVNWLFILLLTISKYRNDSNFKVNLSFDGFKLSAFVIGTTATVILIGVIFLYILPTLFKYVVASIPSCLGIFYLVKFPGFASVFLLLFLLFAGLAIFSYISNNFESIEAKASSTAKIIFLNFPLIVLFNIFISSIFYIKFSILKSLLLQSKKDTPYFFYIIFTFFWSKFVISYVSNIFAFSLLAHSVANQDNENLTKENKLSSACKLVYESFGVVCFLAALPTVFESISHLLDVFNSYLANYSNFIVYVFSCIISFLSMTAKAIASVIYCFSIVSLVRISCFGVDDFVDGKNNNDKDSSKDGKSAGFKCIDSYKKLSTGVPVVCFIYLYFTNSANLLNNNVMGYSFLIAYMMIENIFSLIEPTFYYIADGEFLKRPNCVFNLRSEQNGKTKYFMDN